MNQKAFRAAGKSYVIIQFENIPTAKEKKHSSNNNSIVPKFS